MSQPYHTKNNYNLRFDIYLVGYRDEGESIIFMVREKEKVHYTAVIDCYEYNNMNKTIEILENLGIEKINLLCWTHPDLDHSIGIDKLITKYTIDKVSVPEGIYGNKHDVIKKDNEDIQNNLNSITSLLKKRNLSVSSVNVDEGEIHPIKSIRFLDSTTTVNFRVSGIAPISNIIRKYIENRPIKPKVNDFSIGLLVELDEFKFIFAGDIEERTIRKLDFDLYDTFHYVKIPHHSSYSSRLFVTRLIDENMEVDVATSTSYKKSSLPKLEVLNEYSTISNYVILTGDINFNNSFDFGVIHTEYDISRKLAVNKSLEGNANFYK